MMQRMFLRARYYTLAGTAGTLLVLEGCALSDQQLASIWSSVLTAALNAIVSAVLQGLTATTTTV